jgi:hypothetical protein
MPRWSKCCSSAVAIVDLPEAERPVNQTVQPLCFLNSLRSLRVRPECHVMFLASSHSLLNTSRLARIMGHCLTYVAILTVLILIGDFLT